MARRKIANRNSQPPALPPGFDEQALPPDLKRRVAESFNQAQNDYSQGSFAARHPVISNVMAAGLGGLFMGPMGLAVGPMANQSHEQNRRAGISEAYTNSLKGFLDNQKSIDTIAQPRNQRDHVNKGIRTEIEARRINPNTPLLDSNAVYDTDFLKQQQAGSLNPASLNMMDSVINDQQQQSYGLPTRATLGQPQPRLQDGVMDNGTGQPALNASAQQVYKPINQTYDPSDLPTFMSDSVFGNLQQAQTSVANNALTQGQNRFEFDQEAPKREAEVKKLAQEYQDLILKGKETEARTKLLQIEQKYRAPMLQSEINRNNRPPGGGTASMLEMMDPNQRQAYFDKQAGITSGPPSVTDAYQMANLQNMAGEKEWGTGKPSKRALIAQEALRRLQGGGGHNPQFQSPVGGKPTGGSTVIKGAHGSYSF